MDQTSSILRAFRLPLFIAAGLLSTAGFAAEFRNFETPGNLESTHNLGCVDSDRLNSQNTPADLFKALKKCLDEKKYHSGAFLFAMGGVYGRFDSLRVADKTAHQGVTVLRIQALSAFEQDPDLKSQFTSELKNTLGNPDNLKQVCQEIQRIGPPAYFPRYLIQHGMDAFNPNPNTDGLVTNFDAAAAWKKSLDTYLHCPGLS